MDRRHLIRNAAWAAPVVAVTAAAPLAAASDGTITEVVAQGNFTSVALSFTLSKPYAANTIYNSMLIFSLQGAGTPARANSLSSDDGGITWAGSVYGPITHAEFSLTITIPGYAPATAVVTGS